MELGIERWIVFHRSKIHDIIHSFDRNNFLFFFVYFINFSSQIITLFIFYDPRKGFQTTNMNHSHPTNLALMKSYNSLSKY